MSEKSSEKSEMSSLEFAQVALQSRVAPPSLGSAGIRLRHAISALLRHDRKRDNRKRRWTATRVKDCWYADDRITLNADEIRDLEELTGLSYGQQELRTNDELIDQASALLAGHETDFYSAFFTALRSMARPSNRA